MDFTVRYTTAALSDLKQIVAFIAQDNRKNAEAFSNRLVDLAESLTRLPERGRPVKGWDHVRVVVLAPYLIFYHVDRSSGRVEILRFWHGARDPDSLDL